MHPQPVVEADEQVLAVRLDLAHEVSIDPSSAFREAPLRAVHHHGVPRERATEATRLVVDDISLGHAASLGRVATLAG